MKTILCTLLFMLSGTQAFACADAIGALSEYYKGPETDLITEFMPLSANRFSVRTFKISEVLCQGGVAQVLQDCQVVVEQALFCGNNQVKTFRL